MKYEWGANKGAKQHLFPEPFVAVQAVCGRAYSGDIGITRNSKRKRCVFCEKLEKDTK